jgi:hypothetical protein
VWVYVLAVGLGAVISIVWAWYIQVVAESKPFAAMVSDILVLVLTFAQYQLWAWRDNDWRIFVAIVLGNAPGVYFYLRWKNERRRNVAVHDRNPAERCPPPCEDYRA